MQETNVESPYTTDTERRFKSLSRQFDNRSELSLTNKLAIYNINLKPVRTYGQDLQVIKPSNSFKIQSLHPLFEEKSPMPSQYFIFVKDLRYPLFHSEHKTRANPLARDLTSARIPSNPRRRLKSTCPRNYFE